MKQNAYYLFFSNLSNPLRISIISMLRRKPSSVSELAKKLNVEQSKLSHALSNLKRCRIVASVMKGKKRIYSLNKKTILPILDIIEKHSKVYCKNKCEFCKSIQNKESK